MLSENNIAVFLEITDVATTFTLFFLFCPKSKQRTAAHGPTQTGDEGVENENLPCNFSFSK